MRVRTNHPGTRAVAGLFGLVVLGLGVVSTGGAVVDEYGDHQRGQQLVTTEGTVLTSDVVSERGPDGDPVHYPRVTYRYRVGDTGQGTTRHEGDRIFSPTETRGSGDGAGRGFENESRAQRLAGEYVPGETVTVHYDPERPERSALRRPAFDTDHLFDRALSGLAAVVLGVVTVAAALFARVGVEAT